MVALVAAIALNLGLTQLGRQVYRTFCDYHGEVIKGPVGEPIVPFWQSISDSFGFGQGDVPRAAQTCAFATTYGVFTRPHIPDVVALWVGVVVPVCFAIMAMLLALNTCTGILRQSFSIGFGLLGICLGGLLSFLAVEGIRFGYISRMLFDRQYDLLWAIAAFLMGTAFWLWRGRSLKQPA